MRKKRSDSVDLKEMARLTQAFPVKTWVALFLIHLSQRAPVSIVLQKSKGIPSFPLEREVPPGGFDFDKIINRLKLMSGLDPVAFKEPRQGKISLRIRDVSYTISTTFIDSPGDRQCEITMSEGDV